jgi:hypothetical protein
MAQHAPRADDREDSYSYEEVARTDEEDDEQQSQLSGSSEPAILPRVLLRPGIDDEGPLYQLSPDELLTYTLREAADTDELWVCAVPQTSATTPQYLLLLGGVTITAGHLRGLYALSSDSVNGKPCYKQIRGKYHVFWHSYGVEGNFVLGQLGGDDIVAVASDQTMHINVPRRLDQIQWVLSSADVLEPTLIAFVVKLGHRQQK